MIRYSLILLLAMIQHRTIQAQSAISLNGEWEIIFDDKNEGRQAKWMQAEVFATHPNRQTIEVPAAWERSRKDYEGVAFYYKNFEVPAAWKDQVIRLQFGAVNYLAEVWLNDEVVGFHEGGFTPFEFRVDEMIKAGETNVLTLRVVGPIVLTQKVIDGVGPMETPQWRGGITGGIWQEVQLIATGPTYIDDVYIEPKISDHTATFYVELDHTAIQAVTSWISIDVTEAADSSKKVAAITEKWELRPGQNKQQWTLTIPDAQYWSPTNPYLYQATIKITSENQNISDQWSQRFGLRELTIKNKDFYLNNKKIYIKATFFEGLYPNGIAYPDSKEMARKEIQLAKDAGFNMIRPWRRPPVPMWLDLADEMGVLVVGSPALECMTLPRSTPYLPKRVENEIREAIVRDRNRACIVQWELFNELHRPVLKQLMRPMAMLARNIDPSRLILDESGGWAFGANIYLPYEYEPTKFNDIHNYPGPFINEQRYDGFLTIGMTEEEKEAFGFRGRTPGRNVVPGLMSFVSELGYGSLPDLVINNRLFTTQGNVMTPAFRYHQRIAEQQRATLDESGFGKMYPNLQKFCLDQQEIHGTANKRMIEAVRSNPAVDGYCIHALVAGDWILGAGLLDLWRNPKTYAYEGTKAANQPRIISIRTRPRNIYAEKGGSMEIIGINEMETEDVQLHVDIISNAGKRVFQRQMSTKLSSGVSQLLQEQLKTSSWQGSYNIQVKVVGQEKEVLTENTASFDVFNRKTLRPPKKQVAVLDKKGTLTTFLKQNGIPVINFDPAIDSSIPVFVTGSQSVEEGDNQAFSSLQPYMQAGGTVVYIEGVNQTSLEDGSLFPFQGRVHPVVGLWTCIPHLVHDHPIFAGLPVNTMMRDVYENVWARSAIRDLQLEGNAQFETIVGSIGFDWFSREHKMHYSGPGDSWWGSDVAIIPVGKGRCFVSQLHLVENLGKDPVADQIMYNIIRYASK